jgi:dihydrofolate reductase
MIAIVVAFAANRVIGRDGTLPWRLPSDMRHFRELTTGGTVLMGRRTFDSLPDRFRPLPERRNLVLSHDPDHVAEGAEVFTALAPALAACAHHCFVIGGEQTYRETLALCQRVHATEIAVPVAGDVRFPELDPGQWRLVHDDGPCVENDLEFSFRTYERAR